MLACQYFGNRYIRLLHDESKIRKIIRRTVENTESLVVIM
jgi:hypothetical protein